MSAISNVHAIHIVRCSWCNRLGHEQVNCPIWIGCIAHEREKQARLKAMQPCQNASGEGSLLKGTLSGLFIALAVYAFVAYLVFHGIRP